MPDHNLTDQQAAQSEAAQQCFTDLLNSMIETGLDYRAILAGVGTAITASLLHSTKDVEFTANWFENNATLVRSKFGHGTRPGVDKH